MTIVISFHPLSCVTSGNIEEIECVMHKECIKIVCLLRERILGIRNVILVMQKENIFYVLWLQQKCLEVKHVS